ncbi:DUF2470 domain-containing protein [Streptacidiphilus carbonis]|jgi:hypothetical protein|uniref:DUF2470 domain-containing protein n=1 Tax=Streptacidiphilus carbonis TaxID=105422 RepID=UPI0005A82C7F|nr:DUF2470 domain-containing protein [Streptacidiphilus carbonis]
MRPAESAVDAVPSVEPTDAERVRSVLQAATSLTAAANGGRHDLHGCDLLVADAAGLAVRAPAECRLTRETAIAGSAGLPVLLEWTDLAPLPAGSRVRAQVCVAGRLRASRPTRDGLRLLRLDVRQVVLDTGGAEVLVDPAELVRAEPDPLATVEAALLLHLDEDHQDHVAALTGLIGPRLLRGARRLVPYALDRYGIVLRLEYADAHRDVRLAFGEPLPDAEQVGHRLHALIAAAVAAPSRTWSS